MRNVIWFSGLSGAGKTTLSLGVDQALRAQGFSTLVLDGDELRKSLSSDLGFTSADRAEHVRRMANVAAITQSVVSFVLVATITPQEELRNIALSILPGMREIHVAASLATCAQRDPKGLYARAQRGEISNLPGVDAPFTSPLKPALVCNTDKHDCDTCIRQVLQLLLR